MTTDNNNLPPHSEEAEEAVIGSLLINASAFPQIAAYLKSTDFFNLRNAWVWEAMERLHSRNEIIDYIPVVNELRALKYLDDIGGAAYLGYLIGQTATSVHAEAYAQIVKRTALRRRTLEVANKIGGMAMDEEQDIASLLPSIHDTMQRLYEMFQTNIEGLRPLSAGHTDDENGDYQAYLANMQNAFSFGLKDFDRMLRIKKGTLNTIAARPRYGKSALMHTAIFNNLLKPFLSYAGGDYSLPGGSYLRLPTAVDLDKLPRIALFSLEMSKEQVMNRLTGMLVAVTAYEYENGVSRDKWRDVRFAQRLLEALGDRLLIWDKSANMTLLQAQCRAWKPGTVLVDYIQRMQADISRNSQREEIVYITRGLKDLSLELNIPIIAGAQVSREGAFRPSLETLKESGSIEEDSDTVTFIHREEMAKPNDLNNRPGEADLLIEKQRQGPTGKVTVQYHKELMLFRDHTTSSAWF